jgi:hypothetical protein
MVTFWPISTSGIMSIGIGDGFYNNSKYVASNIYGASGVFG